MTTNETTTDPAAELAALYPLMTKARCWPEEIVITDDEIAIEEGDVWTYQAGLSAHEWVYLKSCHALAIVRDAAEDWLRGRGWYPEESWGRYYHPAQEGWRRRTNLSLPAAIEAELGRGEG